MIFSWVGIHLQIPGQAPRSQSPGLGPLREQAGQQLAVEAAAEHSDWSVQPLLSSDWSVDGGGWAQLI